MENYNPVASAPFDSYCPEPILIKEIAPPEIEPIRQKPQIITPFPLLSLPAELVMQTLLVSAPREINIVSTLNKQLSMICHDQTLWKNICFRDFDLPEGAKSEDWRRYYVQKSCLTSKDAFRWSLPPWKHASIPEQRELEEVHRLPSARMGHTGVTAANGKDVIYIGGLISPGARFDDVYVFHSDANQFEKIDVIGEPTKFARHSSAMVNGKIYNFGGFNGFDALFELSCFDPETNVWENLKIEGECPRPRTNHACAAVGDKIYIQGGNVTIEGQYTVLGDFWAFNTVTRKWEIPNVKGDIPTKRSSHRMIAANGKIYMFGGGVWTPNPSSTWVIKYTDLYCYDPETETWTQLHPTGYISVCTFCMMFSLGSFIFVFGGQSHQSDFCTHTLFCYDSVANHWEEIVCGGGEHAQPKKRDVGTFNVTNDEIVLFAGSSGTPINDLNLLVPNFKLSQVFPSHSGNI
eukprot:TRINITY_DN3505_c0_g1_i1.p1 TRINITY_DN3505_c0_g1~~TRINITY_DN3505_c0_g1_i1.p1  ORF type:complete len:491 (-),score=76.66 TRINITY_DN3505_c0_g1_i1:62-1450(-)